MPRTIFLTDTAKKLTNIDQRDDPANIENRPHENPRRTPSLRAGKTAAHRSMFLAKSVLVGVVQQLGENAGRLRRVVG